MEPAASLVKLFGVAKVAEWTGLSTKQIYCWTYTREKGGTAGRIPQDHITKIVEGAKTLDYSLNAGMFFGLEPWPEVKPEAEAA